MSDFTVQVEGLTRRFGSLTVLQNIHLTVRQGEVVVVMGPSGYGKSTLLRCLTFLEEPDAGRVRIGDLSVAAGSRTSERMTRIREIRKNTGFVFQSFNLFPHRTALENVMEGPVVVLREPPCLHRTDGPLRLDLFQLVHLYP